MSGVKRPLESAAIVLMDGTPASLIFAASWKLAMAASWKRRLVKEGGGAEAKKRCKKKKRKRGSDLVERMHWKRVVCMRAREKEVGSHASRLALFSKSEVFP